MTTTSQFRPYEVDESLTDFRNFVRLLWSHLGLPAPTPSQLSVARTLQHGPKRLIIQAYRGMGKSWTTAAFALWNLYLDPQKRILVVSASQPLADNFSIFCKSLIMSMPELSVLRPRADQPFGNFAWFVGPSLPNPAPSMKSAGITGQVTGSRADLIIADDIEVPKNSLTHTMRERLAEAVKEFDAVIKPGGRIVYLGTPQIESSLYNRLEQRGYETRIWPAEIPAETLKYRGRLSPFVLKVIEKGAKPGDPLDPVRFSREDLDERKLSYGRAGYALQFMLDTSPSDADTHPLKLRDMIALYLDMRMGPVSLAWGNSKDLLIEDLPAGGFDGDAYFRPAWASQEMSPWTSTVMAIDPSGRGTDETAYAIVRYHHGQLYLVDSGGFTDGFGEPTLKALAARAASYGTNFVVCEENFGGGMFGQLLKPWLAKLGGGVMDEEWNGWSRGMKEHRICDTLEPVLRAHKLVIDAAVIERDFEIQQETPAYSLVQQLTRMKREKGALPHDDRVEALSMAVSYWIDRMNRDKDKELEAERQRRLEEEVNAFLEKHAAPLDERWHR